MLKEQTIIPGLSEEKIQYYADNDTIYRRGQEYYKRGAITEVIQSDRQIQAEVDNILTG